MLTHSLSVVGYVLPENERAKTELKKTHIDTQQSTGKVENKQELPPSLAKAAIKGFTTVCAG